MKLEKDTLISNRYSIISKIGSGGMAIVYKAIDKKLDSVVALKIMREEYIYDEEFVEKFNVEAKAAAKLNHPNIVKVYDVGKYKNIFYIVIEYIDCITLKDLINAKGKFKTEEILGVAIQITSALGHAHDNKIVHRDVKPQNILVNVKGEVRVTDFGIATAITNVTSTMSESTIGSVHYFSPEQARGSKTDEKSDIYSIGITMYEMACGKVPFDDDTVVSIALKHINEKLPDINKDNSGILKELIDIINKATEKNKNQRYENAEEMNNELKRVLTKLSGDVYTDDYDFSKTNTLHLTEKDVSDIKKQALDNFYKDDDIVLEDSIEEKENKVVKLAILSSFLIGIILIVSSINYFKGKIQNVVTVPYFVGTNYEEAYKEATNLNIELKIVEEKFDENYKAGEIIEQDYQRGDTIYENDSVKVIVSLGSDKIEVPNVENMNITEGLELLTSLPFGTPKEIYVFDDLIPANVIIKQEPNAGSKIEAGKEITLYISRGKENRLILVPNVIGYSIEEGRAVVVARDLVVGSVMYSESETVEEGKIITQSLTPGTEVQSRSVINFVVSEGMEEEDVDIIDDEDDVDVDIIDGDEDDENQNEDDTQVNENKTKILEISTLYLPENEIGAMAKILQISSTETKVIFEDYVYLSELPLNIEVTSSGITEYQLYVKIDGQDNFSPIGSQVINFNEGN